MEQIATQVIQALVGFSCIPNKQKVKKVLKFTQLFTCVYRKHLSNFARRFVTTAVI